MIRDRALRYSSNASVNEQMRINITSFSKWYRLHDRIFDSGNNADNPTSFTNLPVYVMV